MMRAILHNRPDDWGAAICHPLPLGAALLMAINDHLLKGAALLPGWLTGKISDVAGLFFFPILCFCVARCILGAWGRSTGPQKRWLARGVIVLTGVGFTSANLWPSFNDLLGQVWIDKAMDPSDLLALVMLVPAYTWMQQFSAEGVDDSAA